MFKQTRNYFVGRMTDYKAVKSYFFFKQNATHFLSCLPANQA